MGFNSLIFINNDCMGSIDDHPAQWWMAVKRALGLVMSRRPQTFAFRGCMNHNQAVWNQHADTIGLIAVGGNFTSVLATVHDRQMNHSKPEGKLKLLQAAAEELGYRLVKKSARKETACTDTSSPGPKPEPARRKSSPKKTPSKTSKKPSKKATKQPTKKKTSTKKSSTAKSSARKK